jgi:hypothetical protein
MRAAELRPSIFIRLHQLRGRRVRKFRGKKLKSSTTEVAGEHRGLLKLFAEGG